MGSDNRAQQKIEQFRNLSEADQRLLGRLVADRTDPSQGKLKNVDTTAIASVVRRTLRDTADIRNIFQTQPDLKLARDILVSAVVAPGDLSTTSLVIANGLPGGDTPLTAQILDRLHNFHVTENVLDQKVPDWIDDALVWSGAHPIMILPEASIDRMINGTSNDASMESVASYAGEWEGDWFKPKGILGLRIPTAGSAGYVSLESAKNRVTTGKMAEYHTIKPQVGQKSVTLPFRVTDNLAALRMPAVQEQKRVRAMRKAYGESSLESRRRQRRTRELQEAADKNVGEGNESVGQKSGGKKNEADVTNIYSRFFRNPQAVKRSRLEVVPTLRQSGGSTVGHPLVYHLPSEAVMPVCVPGDETNHIGYIVILDNNGFPLSFARRLNYYDDIRRSGMGGDGQVGSSSQVAGELLAMAGETLNGGIANASNQIIDRIAQLNSEFIEHDVVARIKNGLQGGDVEISKSEHVDRLLLSRTMKNQMTTMLYVPAEMMVYMAYDYNEYGIGKSILEDAKALAAMRANLLVASIIGATKNAIPGKDINIELPEDDADPVGAATFMANEALALAYHQFPTGIVSIQGLAEQLQMSAFSVNVTGNPRFPEVKTSITARESSYVPVDNDLLESLRSDLVRVFSLTPEMIDGANSPEFATTVVRNSLMLLKRVMVLQNITNPMITDYVRIFTLSSGILIEELMEIIENNTKDLPDEYKEDPEGFLEEFLNAMTVKLPAPESDNLTKQIEMYTAYSEVLDIVLPAFVMEEYLHGYMSDTVRESIPTLIASLKGVELRRWMRERGMFRELDVFVNTEDGSPLMNLNEEMKTHVSALLAGLGDYMQVVAEDAYKLRKRQERALKADAKAKKGLEEIQQAAEPEPEPDFTAQAPTPDMGGEGGDTGADELGDGGGGEDEFSQPGGFEDDSLASRMDSEPGSEADATGGEAGEATGTEGTEATGEADADALPSPAAADATADADAAAGDDLPEISETAEEPAAEPAATEPAEDEEEGDAPRDIPEPPSDGLPPL